MEILGMDTKSVLTRIELLLLERGMTKDEFYKKSGISSASYSQWNTGVHKPTLKKLTQAAETLGVTVEHLVYGPGMRITSGATIDQALIDVAVEKAIDRYKKETPTLSKEDERKNIMDLLDELSPAELVELMAKTAEKLKERGLA